MKLKNYCKATISRYLIASMLLLLMLSCQIRGLTNDYGKLSPVEKSKIIALKTFENLSKDTIYKINALQLKEELLKYDAAMVYEFTNGCTSEYCRPLKVYENYAEKHHYKLFLVMDGFNNLDKTQSQTFISPLFAIDGEYYKRSFRTVYTQYFDNELRGKPFKDKEWLGNLFFFEKGKYIKTLNDLPKLE